MNAEIESLMSGLVKNPSPDLVLIKNLEQKIDFAIDKDYLKFIKQYDGASGFLNDNCYLIFWPISDLLVLNPYYEDDSFSNEVFFIGSNGSNMGYGVKKNTLEFFSAPFLGMEEELILIANTFNQFLTKMKDNN